MTEQISSRPTPSTSENFNSVVFTDESPSPTDSCDNYIDCRLRETPDGGEDCLMRGYHDDGARHKEAAGARHKEVLPPVDYQTNNNAAFSSDMALGATGIDREKLYQAYNQCDTDL